MFKVNYSSLLHINKTKDMWDGIVNKAICTDTHTLKLTSSVCSHCNLESNTFATSVKITLIAPPPLTHTHTHIMAPLHTSSQNMQSFTSNRTLWLSLYRGCWLVSPQVWFYTCRWEVWAYTSSSHCCLCQQTTTKKRKKKVLFLADSRPAFHFKSSGLSLSEASYAVGRTILMEKAAVRLN